MYRYFQRLSVLLIIFTISFSIPCFSSSETSSQITDYDIDNAFKDWKDWGWNIISIEDRCLST